MKDARADVRSSPIEGETDSPITRAAARASLTREAMSQSQEPTSGVPASEPLLARLTERWFATRPNGNASDPSIGREGMGSAPGGREAEAIHPLSPSPRSLPVLLQEALQSSRPGGPSILQWTTPIMDATTSMGNGAVPVANNTIHLTVQPPPSLEALDPDELADLLGRILRREARRYGIPMV